MKKIIKNIGKTMEDIATLITAFVVILIIINLFAQRDIYKEMANELLTISKDYQSMTERCISLID